MYLIVNVDISLKLYDQIGIHLPAFVREGSLEFIYIIGTYVISEMKKSEFKHELRKMLCLVIH